MHLNLWGLGRWKLPLESQTSVSGIDVHHVPLYQSTDSKNADVIRIRTSCTLASDYRKRKTYSFITLG